MATIPTISDDVLELDNEAEVAKITSNIKKILRTTLHKRGLIVAISGGVDSAVCAALCVKALGKNKVFGLLLPERDSSPESLILGKQLAEHLGIEYLAHDIAPTLEAIGCYSWRDDAIRIIFPEYTSEWKNKIIISHGAEGKFNYFNLVVQSPGGEYFEKRMDLKEYLQIVAATNYKQRIRKTIEYFHADRLNYAVVGTPNRLEYDQGFFVKNGDGSSDIKPIAHLYKTQVYSLAKHLNIPTKIATAPPTTDTYSLEQGQDEFYFELPYNKMDVALWCVNNGVSSCELAKYFSIDEQAAEQIYTEIFTKRRTTDYLHQKPQLIEPVNILQSPQE